MISRFNSNQNSTPPCRTLSLLPNSLFQPRPSILGKFRRQVTILVKLLNTSRKAREKCPFIVSNLNKIMNVLFFLKWIRIFHLNINNYQPSKASMRNRSFQWICHKMRRSLSFLSSSWLPSRINAKKWLWESSKWKLREANLGIPSLTTKTDKSCIGSRSWSSRIGTYWRPMAFWNPICSPLRRPTLS